MSEQAAEIKQLELDLRTATAQPADSPHLQQQLHQAQQTITSQQHDIQSLQQQLRDKQDKLSQQAASLNHHKRLIEAKLDRLQSDCEQVSGLLSKPAGPLAAGRLPSWLPRSVVLLIEEFRASGQSAGDDRLSLFVLALNKIWKERVEERGRRVKEQYEAEVAELKRRLEQRLPYELVTQKARIVRLQRELDDSRRRYVKRQRGGAASGGGSGGAKDLLDLSLSTVENLSKQVASQHSTQRCHTVTDHLRAAHLFLLPFSAVQLLEVERQNDALKRMLNSGSSASFDSSPASQQPNEDDKLHRLRIECVRVVDGFSDGLWQTVTRWTNEWLSERWSEDVMVVKRDRLLDEIDGKAREARSRIEKAERDIATAAA